MAVTWIDEDDVRAAVGIEPASTFDDGWITQVTAAANQWCYRRRHLFGYSDLQSEVPGDDVKLGTVMYAVLLYNTRGASGGSATFEEFGGEGQVFGGDFREIRRLLGVSGRPMAVG